MVLFEQHPYFVRRSRASEYRPPCSSRAWSASRVGTLPSFFRAGRRLYHSWTVHQCWCSISAVDSFSFFILAFACHAYPAFVIHPCLHQSPEVCSLVFGLFLGLLLSVWPCPNDKKKKKNLDGAQPFYWASFSWFDQSERVHLPISSSPLILGCF